MYAAQLRLPFVFPFFSQSALPRRLRGRTSRAANSSATKRSLAAEIPSDKDQTLAIASNLIQARQSQPARSATELLSELSGLLADAAGPGENPDDLAASLMRHFLEKVARSGK